MEISNKYIEDSIKEIYSLFGVADDAPRDLILNFVTNGQIKECIKEIAKHYGLPIEIYLGYVEGSNFQTKQLVTTDKHGRGVGGITAQVNTSDSIPLYGSHALVNYPITVKISKNVKQFPASFMAVMAHELAHVVLYSLRSMQKENEYYTDLIAMVLGFSEVIKIGRKSYTYEHVRDGEITHTITYGYLSDDQFYFAYNIIQNLRNDLNKSKAKLNANYKKYLSGANYYSYLTTETQRLLSKLDSTKSVKMDSNDTQRIISFHYPQFNQEIEKNLQTNKASINSITTQVKSLNSRKSPRWLNDSLQDLKPKQNLLESCIKNIQTDLFLLIKYTGIKERVKYFWKVVMMKVSAKT
jgi:prefoldin subunit 5